MNGVFPMYINQIYYEELAKNVEDVLLRYNLPKIKTLEKSGAGKSFISNIRGKNSFPSIQKFIALSDFTGISIDEFLGRIEPSNNAINGNVSGSAFFQGTNQGTVSLNGSKEMSKEEIDLFRIFDKLDGKRRHEVLTLVYALEGEFEAQNQKGKSVLE